MPLAATATIYMSNFNEQQDCGKKIIKSHSLDFCKPVLNDRTETNTPIPTLSRKQHQRSTPQAYAYQFQPTTLNPQQTLQKSSPSHPPPANHRRILKGIITGHSKASTTCTTAAPNLQTNINPINTPTTCPASARLVFTHSSRCCGVVCGERSAPSSASRGSGKCSAASMAQLSKPTSASVTGSIRSHVRIAGSSCSKNAERGGLALTDAFLRSRQPPPVISSAPLSHPREHFLPALPPEISRARC